MENQNQGFDREKIVDFCRKNIRYISAGVILVILIIVLAVTVANSNKDKAGQEENSNTEEQIPQGEGEEQGSEEQNQSGAFQEDAIPEINTLMQNYYAAYASGDTAALEQYVSPLTDLEKSYIGVMSQYVTGYENIHCYTKNGLAEGEYAVSVASDMRFEGTENMAPGLGFFYVRTNESGAYYIDNLYSPFNLERRELALDSQVEAFIAEFETQEDVKKLIQDTQEKYEEILGSDEALNTIVNETVPQALKQWNEEQTSGGEDKKDEEGGAEEPQEEPKEEEAPKPEEEEQPEEPQQAEEPQATSETVYAIENVNIRKEAREDAEKVGSAVIGQSFTRTGTTEDGWSAIEFDGGSAYIKSEFLSTDKPEVPPEEPQQDEGSEDNNGGLNYVPEGTTLTLNSSMNVRKSMDENADKVGTAAPGDTVKVVLSYQEGWTKVEWNGTTGYIRTDLLLNN